MCDLSSSTGCVLFALRCWDMLDDDSPPQHTHSVCPAVTTSIPGQERICIFCLTTWREICRLDFFRVFVRVCVCVCVCGKHEPYHLALETNKRNKIAAKNTKGLTRMDEA